MNPQNNWLSWIGNGLTTLAAYLGITTLDLTYLVLAVLGFLLSFLGWLDRRAKIKADRHTSAERLALDRQRTRAVIEFLSKSDSHNLEQADEVVAKVQRVMTETEIQS
ncbi:MULTISPECIES: hypothetical protein [Enterobacter cloacae complex]|uniref:hypothetical protein n=1 Tax=Enterobacter cloacae complex TaxID=354276 RepID=UPI000795C5E1|nr:hypothetical protein [Enterobacter hormaechei]MBT1927150.1 hypothetical protein [Enterobacter hormaechei subsp. hoffmannii]MBT1931938.1 hypothetical protein [Enterobacter hormaechei subsp. hoffmannii]MBT1955546.1 hypothetical protein [Enterobacter hormaechei subsp. hoffmannii]MBT1960298.1 hypothetical protein [Enterobacter hormaechei subsp. hoffmannii]MBT1970175.1 hypothetical protein [Enterobacter hormaechei subsp. hoffmannii]